MKKFAYTIKAKRSRIEPGRFQIIVDITTLERLVLQAGEAEYAKGRIEKIEALVIREVESLRREEEKFTRREIENWRFFVPDPPDYLSDEDWDEDSI